jgi:hypothetical protein
MDDWITWAQNSDLGGVHMSHWFPSAFYQKYICLCTNTKMGNPTAVLKTGKLMINYGHN